MEPGERIARALLGALMSLVEMAEIGVDAQGIAEFADLSIRAGVKALNITESTTQTAQLKDESLIFLNNAGLNK